MKIAPKFISLVFVGIVLIMPSCKKYLDKKPNNDLITPSSLSDLQGLLDDYGALNFFPYPAEILCDDYYLLPTDWNSPNNQNEASITPKNLHLWQKDDNTSGYWDRTYENILITNIVLDELPRMDYNPQEQLADYNNIKGSALFLRSFYFYHLAQLYAKSYEDSISAANDPGIVLRLSADINDPSERASVKATYHQIIKDLKSAASLLPIRPLAKHRPSQPAAYGALARAFLVMHEYDSAGKYADLCLAQYDSLINYNTLDAGNNIPFSRFNKEVIFAARATQFTLVLGTRAKIDSNLYKSYAAEDLRKQIFFKAASGGGFQFKGDYDAIGLPITPPSNLTFFSFTGIVTDEMYLIKAESLARRNNVTMAMATLNKLLETRYKTGQFVALTASDNNEAITSILRERRKQLLHRGSRWSDIKRLMSEETYRILPFRTINNEVRPMTTSNTNYIMQIPKLVILLSGIPQN